MPHLLGQYPSGDLFLVSLRASMGYSGPALGLLGCWDSMTTGDISPLAVASPTGANYPAKSHQNPRAEPWKSGARDSLIQAFQGSVGYSACSSFTVFGFLSHLTGALSSNCRPQSSLLSRNRWLKPVRPPSASKWFHLDSFSSPESLQGHSRVAPQLYTTKMNLVSSGAGTERVSDDATLVP